MAGARRNARRRLEKAAARIAAQPEDKLNFQPV
jgi:hypothetical protein